MIKAESLLDIKTIYYEAAILDFARGREILAQYPDAEKIEVASHWRIPELHGNQELVAEWNNVKRSVLVLGVKKGLQITSFYRSADFIAPSHANGCTMACSYCYVARRKQFANPITTFVNIEQIINSISRHAAKQGAKLEPTLPDQQYWVYELGTNSDCAVDALISDNIKDLVVLFRELPNAKATFATKFVNRAMLDYDPQRKTRLRFSIMPPQIAKIVDVRTAPVEERIKAVNDFVAAGYEVNFNFGPVIVYDNWLEDYARLFEMIDVTISAEAKRQLAAEVIFLTHNAELHEINLEWHPKAEALLWQPDIQEEKISGTGGKNLRYKLSVKRGYVNAITNLLKQKLPYCYIRYAF